MGFGVRNVTTKVIANKTSMVPRIWGHSLGLAGEIKIMEVAKITGGHGD
jgi:hypothetical protein